jgi:lathosterol oxidase
VWVYNGFVTLVTIWAVMIHDRIRWTPLSFINHAGCHMAHHWYFRYNYGQFFTFWDRLCGTYHSPADLPERFSASWPPRRAT